MLIAFAVIALLGLVLRYIFGRGRSATVAWPPQDPDDFGLLAPAAVVEHREDAERLRVLLADAGIKATTSVGSDRLYRVLVFSSELDQARRVAG
jgi:hypothetical protein